MPAERDVMGVRTGRAERAKTNNTRSTGYANEYYTDGNTVRVVRAEAVPKPRHRVPAEEQRINTPGNRKAVRTVSGSINLPATILLVAAVMAVVFVGYQYLCLKSSIDVHMDNVKSLETRLENIKNENDALERSIDTSIDLNHVYEVAVGELGMVRAGRDNIIQYDKTESEYVRQYENIPASER